MYAELIGLVYAFGLTKELGVSRYALLFDSLDQSAESIVVGRPLRRSKMTAPPADGNAQHSTARTREHSSNRAVAALCSRQSRIAVDHFYAIQQRRDVISPGSESFSEIADDLSGFDTFQLLRIQSPDLLRSGSITRIRR